jgi:putative ABC transport system ATP-binding protein
VADPLIVIERLSKIYRRDAIAIPVLQDINLAIGAGEYVALMGPSGSGKTTLLNLIAGIDSATSGRIVVGGRDLTMLGESDLARWRAEKVGFIFQLYNLVPVLTAWENVELPLLLTRLSRKERQAHVQAALAIVGLADREDHYPRQLSGGQEQRVAIARAIVTDPLILVADEPTGDLDARSADEILDLLNRLNREFHKTIVLVTHDPKAAARAHRMLHLDKGVLSADGAPSPAGAAAGRRGAP